MEIKILGTGCTNCITLEKRVRRVVAHNNITADITKIDDIMDIMKYDIVSEQETPEYLIYHFKIK